MKNIILLSVFFSTISFGAFAQTKADKKDTTQHAAFYACAMHPNQKMDKPGKCPVCGMDLVLSNKEQMKRGVTKTYTCPTHANIVSNHPGRCSKCSSKLVVNRKGSKQTSLVYTCGMHPDVISDKEGKCPVCGMALVEKKGSTSND